MATSGGNGTMVLAGAGPASGIAALSLASAGIDGVLLEAGPTLPQDLRASTFDPPALERLAVRGLTRPLIDCGLRSPRYTWRDRRTDAMGALELAVDDVDGASVRERASEVA
jgi:3-(3-hydroxy-phenyl)propionate hydroxylase